MYAWYTSVCAYYFRPPITRTGDQRVRTSNEKRMSRNEHIGSVYNAAEMKFSSSLQQSYKNTCVECVNDVHVKRP